MSSKQPVLLSSPTAKLNPYLDSSGVIRVGGRLSKSKTLPAEVQHPILLPKIPLVKSFLLDFHHKHHHPGPSAMEALLYQSYYPVGCRQMVKSVCKYCVVCRKALAKTIIQFMGDLPDHRISPARPFCWSLRCQKRSHQETCPSQSLCLPLCLYEHQSSAHRLHTRPQHSFLHAVL